MRMTCQMLPTLLKVRVAAGVEGALPNLAPSFLKCVGDRAAEMQWHIRNADVVLHKPHTVAQFDKAAQRVLEYDELLALIDQISVVDEITIFVAAPYFSDELFNEQLVRNDYSAFRICIDLWDSSEWTFVSDNASELACAASVVQRYNNL